MTTNFEVYMNYVEKWREWKSQIDTRVQSLLSETQKVRIAEQDYVDTEIFNLINQLNPAKAPLEWNIEMIGEVRDVIQDWLVRRLKVTTADAFYPHMDDTDTTIVLEYKECENCGNPGMTQKGLCASCRLENTGTEEEEEEE